MPNDSALSILAGMRHQCDTASKFRAEAVSRYHVPGELEIGTHAEVNRTDAGAWVKAYVFIPKKDLQT